MLFPVQINCKAAGKFIAIQWVWLHTICWRLSLPSSSFTAFDKGHLYFSFFHDTEEKHCPAFRKRQSTLLILKKKDLVLFIKAIDWMKLVTFANVDHISPQSLSYKTFCLTSLHQLCQNYIEKETVWICTCKGILVNDESPELYRYMNPITNHCNQPANTGVGINFLLSWCCTDNLLQDKHNLCDLTTNNDMKGQKEKYFLSLTLVVFFSFFFFLFLLGFCIIMIIYCLIDFFFFFFRRAIRKGL